VIFATSQNCNNNKKKLKISKKKKIKKPKKKRYKKNKKHTKFPTIHINKKN